MIPILQLVVNELRRKADAVANEYGADSPAVSRALDLVASAIEDASDDPGQSQQEAA